MLVVLPDPGPAFRAPHLKGCPFCGADMQMHERSDHFFHPLDDEHGGCVLSGKGFHLDDSAKWNGRAA